MYDFKQLSPADFEDLTRDLLQQHWKIQLESFKVGRDQGIDLRYATDHNRSVIIQCKHFASSTVSKLVSHLRNEEYPKIIKLKLDRYVLVTSVPLNPSDKEKISTALHPFVRASGDIFGSNDLNNLIGQHGEVETKHFKLWMSSTAVLQRVLRNASRVQTEFDVERVRRAIPLYVQTSNYTRAKKILDENKFVIISGVPGIGKTTLADMLLYAHLEAGYQPVVVKSEILEAKELFDSEARQVFYFDDFLGETFLGNRFEFLGKKEDSAILNFMDLIARSKKGRLILTTREHVLRHAYHISEHFRRQKLTLAEHKCILELSDYSLLNRGRILYNHIYFSDLPQSYKAALLKDAFYLEILKHRNFNPRLIEWLSRFINVKSWPSAMYREEVKRVLENPEQLWRIAFEEQISDAARSVLLALYSLGGNVDLDRVGKVWKSLHQYRAKKYNWKTAPEDLRRALQDLEGGFLKFEHRNVAFVNPSVKDFLDATISSDTDNLDDLIATVSSFEQIVSIWSLAQSEKGSRLRIHFKKSPEQLMAAASRTLKNPHEEHFEMGNGASGTRDVDVRPEVRLRTMLSIAGFNGSKGAIEAVDRYRYVLVEFWSTNTPDFRAAVEILEAVDKQVAWAGALKMQFYNDLKRAIIDQLTHSVDSADFAAVTDYVGERDKRWTAEDRVAIAKDFQNYLEETFDSELSDYGSADELAEFLDRVDSIGTFCKIYVESYLDQIRESIAETHNSDEEEVSSVREWDGKSEQMPDYMQEYEVRRIFDGLPIKSFE
jgi:Restriction endonuclease